MFKFILQGRGEREKELLPLIIHLFLELYSSVSDFAIIDFATLVQSNNCWTRFLHFPLTPSQFRSYRVHPRFDWSAANRIHTYIYTCVCVCVYVSIRVSENYFHFLHPGPWHLAPQLLPIEQRFSNRLGFPRSLVTDIRVAFKRKCAIN